MRMKAKRAMLVKNGYLLQNKRKKLFALVFVQGRGSSNKEKAEAAAAATFKAYMGCAPDKFTWWDHFEGMPQFSIITADLDYPE